MDLSSFVSMSLSMDRNTDADTDTDTDMNMKIDHFIATQILIKLIASSLQNYGV
jgi:hypothetical protein